MLLDTSGPMCFVDRRDHRHGDAVTLFNAATVRVTHGYVLAEFVALGESRRIDRSTCLRFVDTIRRNSHVDVVFVDEALHDAGMRLLNQRPDKSWSLCDAVSFVLMDRLGLTDALTTDHHFDQSGFTRLLPRNR